MVVYLVLTVLGNLIMWGLRPPSGTSIKVLHIYFFGAAGVGYW